MRTRAWPPPSALERKGLYATARSLMAGFGIVEKQTAIEAPIEVVRNQAIDAVWY